MVFFQFVFEIALLFAVFGFVQRRLGDVDVAAFDQLGHLAVEEGQEQGADVRAVHVGIGHDDDAVVAQFFGIEFFFADACAQSGNQRGDFLAGQHFFKTCFFDVQNFTFERQNRLEFAVAALHGGTACGVALDEVEFGQGRVFFLAVGKFARQAQTVHHAFAAGNFACFAGGFASARGINDFAGDDFGFGRVFFKEVGQGLVDDFVDDGADFAGNQFVFGLR